MGKNVVIKFSKDDTSVAKGLAILMMMFHHCFLGPDRYEGFGVSFFPIGEKVTVMIAVTMKLCVGIFVFLSAYGMMKTFKYSETKYGHYTSVAFCVRRYVKLILGFLAAYIICFVGSCIFGPTPKEVYGGGIRGILAALIDVLGLSDLYSTPTLVGTWWYMSLAVILIFIFPLLVAAWRKIGWILVILLMTVPYFFGWEITEYARWLGTAGMGILFADMEIFEKIKTWMLKQSIFVRVMIKIAVTALWIPAVIFYNTSFIEKIRIPADGILSVFAVVFSYVVLSDFPGLNKILVFLGKHSMNIFLIHTFIRVKWFDGYIYTAYKNMWLIAIMLLLHALILSIVLEWLKKITGYNKLCDRIIQRISRHFKASR